MHLSSGPGPGSEHGPWPGPEVGSRPVPGLGSWPRHGIESIFRPRLDSGPGQGFGHVL